MEGVALSYALLQSPPQNPQVVQNSFGFFYFIDIATVNAFISHKELAKMKDGKSLTQKAFRETLVDQLAEMGLRSTSTPAPSATPGPAESAAGRHRLLYISGDSTKGRLKCRQCHAKMPLKVPYTCLVSARNGYDALHIGHGM